MIDLGQRRDGALAAAAARALLDRDGRRNAVDGVDVGAAGGLDELARVRVQRLEIAALALGEQDVERDRALAAAADARDHRELVARDREVDVPQVVLARAHDLDHVGRSRAIGRRVAGDADARRSKGARDRREYVPVAAWATSCRRRSRSTPAASPPCVAYGSATRRAPRPCSLLAPRRTRVFVATRAQERCGRCRRRARRREGLRRRWCRRRRRLRGRGR